jgi:Cu2+-exporting ATPase
LATAFSPESTRIVSDHRNHVGEGVSGEIDDERWRLGSRRFVDPGMPGDDGTMTTVWLGNERGAIAVFRLDDALRPTAIESLRQLEEIGLSLSLLSGDGEQPVQRTAAELGIADARHSCTPEQKLDVIRGWQGAGEIVAMVGDGINDAPVLSGADASIAPAHASRLAQTHADVIMLGDSLIPVVTAVRVARQTMRVVRQNLAWAIVYNVVALPLAATGNVPPWAAAIGMSASSLIVVLNALRLSRFS